MDFLPSIKSNSIDLIVIDPPYEISRQTHFSQGGQKQFQVSMDFGSWDYDFTILESVIKHCFRVLKRSGTIICFYDLWKITELKDMLEGAGFKQLRLIEWLKTNPVPLNSNSNYLSNAKEIAITAVKGGCPTFNSSYDNGIYEYPIYHGKDRIHPTQKPVALISELIEKHSNAGDTILDCFSGSGTTAIACIKSGRNFVGCELDATYYAKSSARIANTLTTVKTA